MSESAFLARARTRTEARMTDTCTTRRKTGETLDDNTGVTTPTWSNLYAGACRVKQPSPSASPADVGEAAIVLQQLQVHLPMSADILRPNDEITITGSVNDPESVGRVFLVRGPAGGTGTTARRYAVTEVTS